MKDIPERTQVKIEDTWDLSLMFGSIADWQSEFLKIEQRLGEIARFRGTLAGSAGGLRAALDLHFQQFRTLEKLYTFAHLASDEDTRNAETLGRCDRIRNLYSRISADWSFLTPEILAIPDEVMNSFRRAKELEPYRRVLDEMLRYKPHTLSPELENILALASEALSASERIYSQLNNADLTFGTVTVDGQEHELSHGSYMVFLKHRNRTVRKTAFERYYLQYEAHRNTISATLTSSVHRASFNARARNFSGARAQALFSENMPAAVYDNLIATVSKNLSPLHRYHALRKRVLGVDALRSYDLAVPLVADVDKRTTFHEASQAVIAALEPLGSEYVSILKEGLTTGRWVDRYENKGKRSGAYSAGCYDSRPYLLMNYHEESLHDVFTLAHEAGHSMHTYYSVQNQPYQDHSYGIFVAEVASTFNEQLLAGFLEEESKDNIPILTYLLNEQIEDIRATLIRQTMFAEFELEIHSRAERNEPLTVAEYSETYRSLLEKYFGPDVVIEPQNVFEFLRIPHFYSPFYVYKYATGISAAIALSEMVMQGGPPERDRYLAFLKAGGSKYPLEVLRDAGVDMASPEPIERAMKKFDGLVSRLESLLSSRPS